MEAEKGTAPKEKRKNRVALVVWSLAAVILLLVVVFFDVTPADLAYQVSRCLRCH